MRLPAAFVPVRSANSIVDQHNVRRPEQDQDQDQERRRVKLTHHQYRLALWRQSRSSEPTQYCTSKSYILQTYSHRLV